MNAAPSRFRWDEAGRWFVKADEDLRAAGLLLDAEPPLLAIAAYHCQQTAEKLIKGLLAAAGRELQKTHDLDALAELASSDFSQLSGFLDFCRPLTAWNTMFRYPEIEADAAIEPTEDEIENAVRRLSEFRAAVAAQPKAGD